MSGDLARRWRVFVDSQKGRPTPPREILRVEIDEDGDEVATYDVPLESLDAGSPPPPGTAIKSFVPGREDPFVFSVPIKRRARAEGKDLAVAAKACQADTALYVAATQQTLEWYVGENSRLMAERADIDAERKAAVRALEEERAGKTDLAIRQLEASNQKEMLSQGLAVVERVANTAMMAMDQRTKAKQLAADLDGLLEAIMAGCGQEALSKALGDPASQVRMQRVQAFLIYAQGL